MNYNAWKNKIFEGLTKYKVNTLGITGSGYYGKKLVAHILPRGSWSQNFMLDVSKLNYKKHHGYHHLNSSQTMCINFFYPMFEDKYKLLNKLLSKVFGGKITIVKAEFESTDKTNYGDTNFDFFCEDSKGIKYFFEIKYTEKDISKMCLSKDRSAKRHLEVFNEKYKPIIEKEGSYLKKCLSEPLVFMEEHYQAFRNMSVSNEKEKVYSIFLTMKENKGTFFELQSALEYIGGEKKYIKSLYWEDLLDLILNHMRLSPDTEGYFIEFKHKYLDY